MVRSARPAAAAMLLALLALSACSGAGRPAAPGSPAAQWAGSVCSSVQALDASLQGMTAKITITETGMQGTLAQAKQQLLYRIKVIETAAARLSAAVQATPAAASGPVRAAQQQLAAVSAGWKLDVARVAAAATAVQSAGTPAEFVQRVSAANGAAVDVANGIGSLSNALRRYVTSSEAELKQAFGNAPACKALA